MPLPNESVFSTLTDFDLSHDLFYLIDISGGAKDVCIDYIMGFYLFFSNPNPFFYRYVAIILWLLLVILYS
jgi:hypothetical protein